MDARPSADVDSSRGGRVWLSGMTGLRLDTSEVSRGVICLSLFGELDLDGTHGFDEALRRLEADAPEAIVLDLRSVRFCDSSGLASLLAVRRRAKRAGHRLVLVRGSSAIERLLAVTALNDYFEIVDHPGELQPSGGPTAAAPSAAPEPEES